MNRKLALLVAPVIMLAASTATAKTRWGFSPYVGADAQWRHMNFNTGLGRNLFAHDYPQGNLFAGVKFNDYIGIEVGYESTTRKSRTVTLNPGDLTAGIRVNYATQFTSTSRIKGPHANLVGSFPICRDYRLKLIGLIGVAQLKAHLVRKSDYIYIRGIPRVPTRGQTTTFVKRKNVLRLGAGLEHMFTEDWGVRATVIWENTKRFHFTESLEVPAKYNIKMKNSLAYGLGMFVTF